MNQHNYNNRVLRYKMGLCYDNNSGDGGGCCCCCDGGCDTSYGLVVVECNVNTSGR